MDRTLDETDVRIEAVVQPERRDYARLAVFSAIAGIQALAYALVVRVFAELIPGAMVTLAAVVVLPLAMGAVAGEMASEPIRRSMSLRSAIALSSAAVYLLLLFVSELDGPLYLLAMSPPALLAAAGGSALSGVLMEQVATRSQRHLIVAIIAASPMVLMLFERTLPTAPVVHSIGVQTTIGADRQTVWETLLTIDTIRPAERPPSMLQEIGAPRLMSTRMVGEGRQAVRIVSFDQGIEYEEVITEWSPPERLGFRAEVDPEWIPPEAIDPDLRFGSDELDLIDGMYAIDSISERVSRLRVVYRYSMKTDLATYLTWWTDLLITDAQESVLEIVRERAEEGGGEE